MSEKSGFVVSRHSRSGVGSRDKANLKIVLVGNSGVGKTSVLSAIYGDPLHLNPAVSTIGVDCANLYFTNRHNREYKFQMWDTAGQERFQSLMPSYYRNANVAILVFSLVDRKSFLALSNWYKVVTENMAYSTNRSPTVFLFGNKKDLLVSNKEETTTTTTTTTAAISEDEINQFVKSRKIVYYFKVSAFDRNTPEISAFLEELINEVGKNELAPAEITNFQLLDSRERNGYYHKLAINQQKSSYCCY